MKYFLPIIIISVIYGSSIASAQETLILPDGSAPVDARKISQCRKMVDEINSIQLRCDTILRENWGEEVFSRFQGLYFDKKGRLRKYVREQTMNDGAHECGMLTAYYDKNGDIVYIENKVSNNCEDGNEYFYIDNGKILDFRCFEYCGCCEEEYFREEFQPWVGSTLAHVKDYLASYSHIHTLLDYGIENGNRTVTAALPYSFPKTESGDLRYYAKLEDIKGVVRDSLENSKIYFIPIDYGLRAAVYKDGQFAVFDVVSDKLFNSYDIELVDIGGAANAVLVVRWKMKEGRSGMDSGFTSEDSGIVVWDLDTFTCLLDLQDTHDYNFWWQDSHDKGGNLEYMKHQVSLGREGLIIGRGTQYIMGQLHARGNGPAFKYVYKLTETGFILDKVLF